MDEFQQSVTVTIIQQNSTRAAQLKYHQQFAVSRTMINHPNYSAPPQLEQHEEPNQSMSQQPAVVLTVSPKKEQIPRQAYATIIKDK